MSTVSGIYEIVNLASGKRYVGSAVNTNARWSQHRYSLRRGKHHCTILQRAWDKYGEGAFEFRILLVCKTADLIANEQSAFDRLRPEYNIARVAGSCLGVRHGDAFREKRRAYRLGRKASPETKAKIAAAQLGRKISKETLIKRSATRTGRKLGPMSDAHKAAISLAHAGRSLSSEHSAAISRGKIGAPRPDMIGNCWGRRIKTEAERQRSANAQRGKPKHPGFKAKMREMWAKRKALSAQV